MTTAQRIRQTMEHRGLSINELAEQTLIPRVSLQRKLNDRTDFTVTELRHIAKALCVRTSSLIDDAAEVAA